MRFIFVSIFVWTYLFTRNISISDEVVYIKESMVYDLLISKELKQKSNSIYEQKSESIDNLLLYLIDHKLAPTTLYIDDSYEYLVDIKAQLQMRHIKVSIANKDLKDLTTNIILATPHLALRAIENANLPAIQQVVLLNVKYKKNKIYKRLLKIKHSLKYINFTYQSDKTLQWQKLKQYPYLKQKEAIKYCKKLKFETFSDWRLPTIIELQKLYLTQDYKQKLLNSKTFHSISIKKSNLNWFLQFYNGKRDSYLSKSKRYVICLRTEND